MMELCQPNCSLDYFLNDRMKKKKEIAESEVIKIIDCVLRGLYELNKINIIHRDIKLDNVIRLNRKDNV